MSNLYDIFENNISVIIPTYNRARTIKKSIESVLNQSIRVKEVIVSDDGSSDDTEQIVATIDDKRIIFLKAETNNGACHARNKGIETASSEYIAFQDSDDIWLPNKLERNVEIIVQNKVDVVVSNHNIISENGQRFFSERKSALLSLDELLYRNYCSTQTMFGKKEVFQATCFDINLPRFQDWDISIRIAKKYKLYYDSTPLVNLYVGDDSITKSSKKGIVALERIVEKYKEDFENNLDAYSHQLIILSTLYKEQKDRKNAVKAAIGSIKIKPSIKGFGCLFLSFLR